MLGETLELRGDVGRALGELAALAREAGSETLAQTLDAERKRRLEEERFHLVVVGEFNRGKSSIINALLGGPVLPVGILPTTAALTLISEAPFATARAIDHEGRARSVEWKDLEQVIAN